MDKAACYNLGTSFVFSRLNVIMCVQVWVRMEPGYWIWGNGPGRCAGVLIQIPSSGVARAAGLNKRWIHAEYRHRSWRHEPGCSEVWAGGNNLYQHKHLI